MGKNPVSVFCFSEIAACIFFIRFRIGSVQLIVIYCKPSRKCRVPASEKFVPKIHFQYPKTTGGSALFISKAPKI